MVDLEQILKIVKRENYGYSVVGDNPDVVLVGEKHAPESLDLQEELISVVRPVLVLHERVATNETYHPEYTRIIGWRERYGVEVSGLDVPHRKAGDKDTLATREGFDDHIMKLLNALGCQIPDYDLYQHAVSPLREAYMAKLITSNVQHGKVPVIAVVGNWHIMPWSVIQHTLQDKKISYVVIQGPGAINALQSWAESFKR
ncbi:hypothetical protein HYV83_04565 [Candidatus Woesearchaeota archaeon]|nr:hypothetical protein [Candidatus Woesearchaeota archaeon]